MARGDRRPFEWYSAFIDFADLAAGSQTNMLMYNAVTHGTRNIKGATITRMLMELVVRSNSVAQDNILFWGIVIVNSDARAAAAFPEPRDVSDRPDWLARGRMQNKQSDLSDSSQWTTKTLDLRTQRIIRAEEDELHLIIDNDGSLIFEWSAYVRTLVRLP